MMYRPDLGRAARRPTPGHAAFFGSAETVHLVCLYVCVSGMALCSRVDDESLIVPLSQLMPNAVPPPTSTG